MNDYVEYKDGKLYWKVKLSPRNWIGKQVGTKMNTGYLMFRLKGKAYLVHRVIWELHYGKIPDGLVIDHINHIKDDNRIENLRLLTV